MKKVLLIMVTVFIFPKLLAAQDFDADSLLGESWYGLYLNGQKSGYARNVFEKDGEGNYIIIEDAQFQISMAGIRQDMHVFSRREYGPDGGLRTIASKVKDPVNHSEFHAVVAGDTMRLRTVMADTSSEIELPAPKESLSDAVKHAKWVLGDPQPGDVMNFSVFEPMYRQEIAGMSHIVGIEERVLDGIKTSVYKIKTSLDMMGLDSVAYVAENGDTLEDVVGGIIVMRLEPEEQAKDVNYSNDVIVSNAALIEKAIENARSRENLELIVRGPLTKDHLFNDTRQTLVPEEDHFHFTSRRLSAADLPAATLPVEDEEAARWLKPTTFVQSGDPRLIAKAKEIAGGETDALKVMRKLCNWVNENMTSTFSARLTNALEVLSNLEGDCTEHSILFIGLARAAGLPAREVAGLIYVGEPQPGFYFHQWAMVWIGRWVDVDPTFNQPFADVTHIKLAEGDLLKQAKLIPIIGQLQIELPGEMRPEESTGREEEAVSGS
jgi:hypothetical protein